MRREHGTHSRQPRMPQKYEQRLKGTAMRPHGDQEDVYPPKQYEVKKTVEDKLRQHNYNQALQEAKKKGKPPPPPLSPPPPAQPPTPSDFR